MLTAQILREHQGKKLKQGNFTESAQAKQQIRKDERILTHNINKQLQ
jgi:hypothetical protein